VLRAGKFDALMLTGWHLKSYVQAILAAKRAGIPVMVRGGSHLGTPRHAAKRMAKAVTYPALLRLFDAALYVGVRNRAYYEHYRFPPRCLFHAPHCVATRAPTTARSPITTPSPQKASVQIHATAPPSLPPMCTMWRIARPAWAWPAPFSKHVMLWRSPHF
jgi:hypothetical protein